jgi:hypothetical protein
VDLVTALYKAKLISEKKYNLQRNTVDMIHERRRLISAMKQHVIRPTKENKRKVSTLTTKIRKNNEMLEGMG